MSQKGPAPRAKVSPSVAESMILFIFAAGATVPLG
jgi:hypothetical protein